MSSPTVRLAALLVALALACAVGLWVQRRNGRSRAVVAGEVVTAADLGAPLGDRATFLQLSSEVCAPCRATARVLGALVPTLDGVTHVEVDAAQRLDLARRLSVVRTPTVLVLDPAGRVVGRTSGAMTSAQARAAVGPLLDGTSLADSRSTSSSTASSDALGASR
jgi:thiol-disulfide isomerase/thioredoxin